MRRMYTIVVYLICNYKHKYKVSFNAELSSQKSQC